MENLKEFKRNSAPSAITWSQMVAVEFLTDLQDFFYARQDRLDQSRVSREYADYREKAAEDYDTIKAKLDEKTKDNLFSLNTAYNNLESITKELSYRQGFSDGVRFVLQALMAGA